MVVVVLLVSIHYRTGNGCFRSVSVHALVLLGCMVSWPECRIGIESKLCFHPVPEAHLVGFLWNPSLMLG